MIQVVDKMMLNILWRMLYVSHREFNASLLERLSYKPLHAVERPAGLQCSMFAVWGDRTADGQLFSGRNLDWNKDTG